MLSLPHMTALDSEISASFGGELRIYSSKLCVVLLSFSSSQSMINESPHVTGLQGLLSGR